MIVTSFAEKGWKQYGKRFVETFLDKWPASERLVIYHEGMPEDAIENDRIEWRNLFEVEGLTKVLDDINASEPVFKGQIQVPVQGKDGKQEIQQQYDYRYDAFRFCRKVFAIVDAAYKCDDRYLAWIDADVVTHSEVPINFIESLIDDNAAIAYLGREWTYTECGFMVFDLSNPMTDKFLQSYKNIYTTGAFRLVGEWHDSYLFDVVRLMLKVPGTNIAKGLKHDHPFINTILGKYMDHLKGPKRKQDGRSLKQEAIMNESHPYWGGITQKEHVA
jgi:hypothetical protein